MSWWPIPRPIHRLELLVTILVVRASGVQGAPCRGWCGQGTRSWRTCGPGGVRAHAGLREHFCGQLVHAAIGSGAARVVEGTVTVVVPVSAAMGRPRRGVAATLRVSGCGMP
jgi:hypothetical protein